MRLLIVAALAVLLPLGANAQTQSAAAPPPEPQASSGLGTALAMTAGVIGAAVVADIITGGALSGPLMRAVNWEELALPPVSPTTTPMPKPWWRFW